MDDLNSSLPISAEDALAAKKEKKRKQDREAKQRQRERERADRAQEGDPELLQKLEHLDQTEEYYHKSEARSRVALYNIYLERAAGKKILGEVVTFDQWLDLRDRARKDLFFLASELLGFKKLEREVHQPVCDMFVKKDFDGVYYSGFTTEDITNAFWRLRDAYPKERLILDPRGFFKTSINISDIVQWLLVCPDVRILLLTAEHDRAIELLRAVKAYFVFDEGVEEEHISDLIRLFPDYALTGVDGVSTQPLNTPARVITGAGRRVGASLWVKSQKSQKTGSHADVIKRDDIVTPENSTTPELRAKARKSADDTAYLVDPHGFIDTIGTRYAGGKDPDYYGVMLTRAANSKSDKKLAYFVRACWVVKPQWTGVKLKDITQDMVELTFSNHQRNATDSFNALMELLEADEHLFRNQQLNEPIDDAETSDFVITFTEDLIRANTYSLGAVPVQGEFVMAGDTALSTRSTADFSCFAVGKIWQVPKVRADEPTRYGLTIVEIDVDKWTQTEIATHLVQLNNKYPLSRPILIEKAAGAETLQEKIRGLAIRYGKQANVNFVAPSNVQSAKATRIKALEILLKEGRLKFVGGKNYDALMEQFTKFTTAPGNKGRKDDIPDAISMLVKFLPASSQPNADLGAIKRETDERVEKANRDAQRDAIFGNSSEQPRSFVAPPVFTKPPSKGDAYREALKRIFGRK